MPDDFDQMMEDLYQVWEFFPNDEDPLPMPEALQVELMAYAIWEDRNPQEVDPALAPKQLYLFPVMMEVA